MKQIKLIVLYQVIMHYRLPLYERLEEDPEVCTKILYGKDQKGSKLVSVNLNHSSIKHERLGTLRIPFRTNNFKGTMPLSPFLFFSLISNSPDVILSEGASSIMNASVGFIYSKLFKKKFIWWSLGKLEGREHKGRVRTLLNKWERYIAVNSDAIFTYSNLGKNHFINEGVNKEKIFVGVNVLDTERKLKEIEIYNNKKYNSIIDKDYFNIAFIGSVTKEKNLETLIEAVNIFNRKYDGAAILNIIGDGNYMKELKSIVGQDNTSVVFHGRINDGPSRILSKCDVMILPGLGGLAICEAMLNKLPVISGKADGTEYDLINNQCGFILEEINSELIFTKIEILFLNPELRKMMGKESFRRITTEFHFNKYYNSLKKAIKFTLN